MVYERLREVPGIVKSFCFGYGGVVVGGAAKFLAGTSHSVRDWDVIIPVSRWSEAARIIPYKSQTNTFGGVKIASDGVEVDVWSEDLVHYFETISGQFEPIAVNIRNKQVITGTQFERISQ